MQGIKELLGRGDPSESCYQTVKDPSLRDYLSRFEKVFIAVKKMPVSCEFLGYTFNSIELGLHKSVVILLQRRVRHLGIIEPIFVVDGDSSLFHFARRKKVVCFDQDGLRAFAAICWKVRECTEEGRDIGGWENLVSETWAAIGPHNIASLIKDPKDLPDSANEELRARILKIGKRIREPAPQSKKSGRDPKVVGTSIDLGSTQFLGIPPRQDGEASLSYNTSEPEARIIRLEEVKKRLLDEILSLRPYLYQKELAEKLDKWDQQELDALLDKLKESSSPLDKVNLKIVSEDSEEAKWVARLIVLIHVADRLAQGELETYNPELADLSSWDLQQGIRTCLRQMEQNQQLQNLGSLARVMVRAIVRDWQVSLTQA